jgi:butyryl-CoA dehydrogenase
VLFRSLIYKLRNLEAGFPRLQSLRKYDPDLVDTLLESQREGREFGERYLKQAAIEIDQRIGTDHSYFPRDLVKKGLPYHFLSYIIPKTHGGYGKQVTHMAVLMEELCSYCPGVALIFGAHALGIAPLLLAPDLRQYERYLREVAEKEQAGEAVIFALAITEPTAGSDVEDVDFLRKAKLSTRARKVPGGYLLNGRKCFISNGNVARYVWVFSYLDQKNPVESSISFVVPNHAPGFSVGRVESKLGQRASPAAELVFEDVFIPAADRVGEEGEGELLTSITLGASRGPVAAIATGIARGAFERLLEYLQIGRAHV